jgi:branched-chain amino acid transport system substrate-binding protein
VLQEKVHFMVGPLCGHEGPAVAQVSKETGVPLVMDAAGADNVTKWDRTPTVVRTAISSSQIGHPFGEYLYKELGLRNVTFIGQDYTFGHEVTLGAIETFKALGGKVARLIWNPIGTKDYGTTIATIPADTDGVAVTIVGADRIRLFEDWFSFGMDKKHKIYGTYWLQEDMLPQVDDRAIG